MQSPLTHLNTKPLAKVACGKVRSFKNIIYTCGVVHKRTQELSNRQFKRLGGVKRETFLILADFVLYPSPTPPRHREGLPNSSFPYREGGWGVRLEPEIFFITRLRSAGDRSDGCVGESN
jgi:hypothetical protein